jgi:outer membrane lipoprotein-sorting protein
MRWQDVLGATWIALGGTAFAEPALWGRCAAEIRELVDRADRIYRGESSEGVMTMKVHARGTSTLRLKFWSKGRDDFLVKIVSPSQLRGSATLKSGDHLWNYLPRVDRVVRLGSSMMGSSWMGSHFTNDDLVKETDLRRHYDCAGAQDLGEHYVVTLTPRPDAPVVWGKLLMKIRKEGPIPVWSRYYDERGELKRTLRFERVRTFGPRRIPTRLVLQPADAPSERTVVTYRKIRFDVPLAERTFTLQGLKE